MFICTYRSSSAGNIKVTDEAKSFLEINYFRRFTIYGLSQINIYWLIVATTDNQIIKVYISLLLGLLVLLD